MNTDTESDAIKVVIAIREATVAMQKALNNGEQSYMIDANDLIDVLLDIAEKLER